MTMYTLDELLFWALAHCGLVYIITESAIFSPVRVLLTMKLPPSSLFVTLLYCPACVSFWIGVLYVLLLGLTFHVGVPGGEPLVPWGVMQRVFTVLGTVGVGALWGALRQASVGLMWRIEQGRKVVSTEVDDDDATQSEAGGPRRDAE